MLWIEDERRKCVPEAAGSVELRLMREIENIEKGRIDDPLWEAPEEPGEPHKQKALNKSVRDQK